MDCPCVWLKLVAYRPIYTDERYTTRKLRLFSDRSHPKTTKVVTADYKLNGLQRYAGVNNKLG